MESASRWMFAIVIIAGLGVGVWWSRRSGAEVDCGRGGCTPPPPPSAALRDSASVEIELGRSACFGRCPIYTLQVRGTGEIVFHGEQFVEDTGTHTGTLAPGQLAALLQAFDRARYLDLADRYVPGVPECGDQATDHPSVWTALTVDGHTKRVEHYTGCRAAPAVLDTLEQAIDRIVGTGRWTGAR